MYDEWDMWVFKIRLQNDSSTPLLNELKLKL